MNIDLVLSGIKPTGRLTLGNYLGAIRNWLKYQDTHQLWVFVANLHSLTIPLDPTELQQQTLLLGKALLACGIDPNKSVLFLQSDIAQHGELSYIVGCESYLGELQRMHQYKEWIQKEKSIPTGILTYPTLMAADILLYDAAIIPVGEDQKQHVEIARDLAIRANKRLKKDLFRLPEPVLPPLGGRIMSLSTPTKKMSKSDPTGEKATIFLDDSDQAIRKKIASAVTDLVGVVSYDPIERPGISNLVVIYSLLKGCSLAETEAHFAGKQYGYFKNELADLLIAELTPIRNKMAALTDEDVRAAFAKGAFIAQPRAIKKMNEVKKAFGLSV